MSFTASLKEIVSENHNGLLGAKAHWPRQKLKDVVTIMNGFPYESSRFSEAEGVDGASTPLMRIRDIVRGRTDTFYSGEVDSSYLVKRGELVVGMDGDFNSALWAGEPALLNQRVCKLTPDETVLRRKFLAYVLPGYLSAINHATPSVTVKHLSSRTVGDIPLPLPSLEEQDEVVDLLDTEFSRLEAGVTALKRAQANLKRYRAAVLKAACEGRLVPTEAELARAEGREYETGAQLVDRILAERREGFSGKGQYVAPASVGYDLPSLPEGWQWATFEQLSKRVTVGFVGPMKHEYVPEGIPFLRSQNIRENRFDYEGLLYVRNSFHEKLSKSLVQAGDLAVVRSGSVGVTCVIPKELGEANCSDLVLIQKPLGLIPQFGAYYMNSLAKQRVEAGKVGVALTHFNTKAVAAMPVPLPPLTEQARIVAEVERRLSVADRLEATLADNLHRATRLRQSVLTGAFQRES